MDNGYRWILRPLLFRLPPERAQAVADFFLARRVPSTVLGSVLKMHSGRLFVELCGVTLENPVGLAAGYDKNCDMVGGLSRLGFGYLTVGTVTETARPGNDAPRLLRLPKEQSLLNALGFPGAGLEAAAAALERSRDAAGSTLLIVSVAGTAVEEFVRCHRRLEPLVDAIELNISSPNTSGLKMFQEPEALGRLIGEINDGRQKPLLVKLPWCGVSGDDGSVPGEERERLAALARVSVDGGVDALTVANTRPTADDRLSTGAGGLSGRGVFENMLAMVADVRSEAGNGVAINACGGIFSGEDAWRALKAGATTVQLFTGMVYRGPGIARMISQELLTIMDREGVDAFMYALVSQCLWGAPPGPPTGTPDPQLRQLRESFLVPAWGNLGTPRMSRFYLTEQPWAQPRRGQMGGLVGLPSSLRRLPNVARSSAARVIGLPCTNSLAPRVKPPVQARIASLAPVLEQLSDDRRANRGLVTLDRRLPILPETRSIPCSPERGVNSTR